MSIESTYSVFAAAAADLVELVERIDPASYAGPGLGEWDLRALVGHASRSLITATTYADQPADAEEVATAAAYFVAATSMAGADPAAVADRGRAAGEALGERPATVVRDLAATAADRLLGQTDILVTTVVGGMWLSRYLPTRTFELVVHGYDIARATGLDFDPDEEALGATVALAGEIAIATGRAGDVLVALTGRTGLPAGFSLV